MRHGKSYRQAIEDFDANGGWLLAFGPNDFEVTDDMGTVEDLVIALSGDEIDHEQARAFLAYCDAMHTWEINADLVRDFFPTL